MENKNADISLIDLNHFKNALDYLESYTRSGIDSSNESLIVNMLDNVIDFESYLMDVGEFTQIERLTINKDILGKNDRIEDIGFLKYPPAERVKSYGRCNMRKQSILYASFGGLNVLSEMKPALGDLITRSIWKNKENEVLTFCPINRMQPSNETINLNTYHYNKQFERLIKNYPPNLQTKIQLLSQFVSNAFSKRFRNRSNDCNYLISAYFSDIILNKYQNGEIDAIFYPSVQQQLSLDNLAIKPKAFDEKYELMLVKESIVVKTPEDGDGGYFTEGISECKEFDLGTNKVLWGNKFYQSNEKIEYYRSAGYGF